jgi:uncharacterized protein YllA (UPF0747 family)
MTYKPIPTKKFKKFLKQRGLKHIRNQGDHEIWDFPKDSQLLRPITIVGCEKEIPALHIQTNLKTLNISYEDFIKEITC